MRGKANQISWLLCALFLLGAACTAAGKVIYVDAAAGGANDGSSWANAHWCLQDALANARTRDEIRVAHGICKPDQRVEVTHGGFRIVASADRKATFQCVSGVAVRGGYAGPGQADPNARDVELYETILSGDLNGDDADVSSPEDMLHEPSRAENSYHVITSNQTDQSAVLDGFTISGGNANASSRGFGGGLLNEYGSLRVTNCTFIDNSAQYGGGMQNNHGSPSLADCTFIRNSAYYGGAMYNGGSPTLTNCTFTANSVYDYGGAIYSLDGSPSLVNCIFAGNRAGRYGAGMSCHASEPTLTNCTFTGNRAPYGRTSAFNGGRSTARLTNCILSEDGDVMWNNDNSRITISYSDVQGGFPGEGNIDVDPLFAVSGYWDPNGTPEDIDDDFWVDGDYHLKSEAGRWDSNRQTWVQDELTSLCIDAGDPFSPLGYEPPPNGNGIDMGAYGGTPQASMSPREPNGIGVLAQASNPIPADQAVNVSIFPRLNWTADPNAILHHVYFGMNEQPPFAGSLAQTRFVPAKLAPYTMYYWRVDDLDDQAHRTVGNIWTFVTGPPPLQAYDPYPANGATGVSPGVTLSWAAGFKSISHDVYFGTTDPPPFVRNQTETEFDPGLLEGGTTYFWCIDEISNEGTTTGQVWMFVTGPSSSKGRACFTGETGVWLDGALVPISQADLGQHIDRAAGDLSSSLAYFGKVQMVQAHKGTFACYNILLESGNCISVAECHYFLTESGRWAAVQDLKAGMRLQTAKGLIGVLSVAKRPTPYVGKVYNLKVEGSDRYMVGQDAVIVRDY